VAEEVPAEVKQQLAHADPQTRSRGLKALARRMDTEAVVAVVPMLDDTDSYCRDYACVVLLGAVKDPVALETLASMAHRVASDKGRLAAADAMAATGRAEVIPGLLRLKADRSPRVRETCLDALARIAPPDHGIADATLRSGLGDAAPGVRAAALEGLLARKAADAADLLEARLDGDADGGVRAVAALHLARIAGDRFLLRAPALSVDADWAVRVAFARGAAVAAGTPPMETLASMLEDKRVRVRDEAHDALRALSGLELPPDRAEWLDWWTRNGPQWKGRPVRKPAPGDRPSVATYHGLPFRSDSLLFVVDLSGSMAEPMSGGDKRPRIEGAKEELARTLYALRDDSRTDVLAFMVETERALGKLTPLNGAVRRRIETWFGKRPIGQKGDLGAALLEALADREVDTVLLLGDGASSTGEFLFRERIETRVRQALRLRPITIHAVIFGGRPTDRRFVGDLVESTGGRTVER
jgi:HEAT repeat protein